MDGVFLKTNMSWCWIPINTLIHDTVFSFYCVSVWTVTNDSKTQRDYLKTEKKISVSKQKRTRVDTVFRMDIVVDAEKKFTGVRSVLIYFYFAHVVEW